MIERQHEQHVTNLITDYVLGLLPRRDRDNVALHISVCVECQKAVLEERRLGHLVRSTMHAVASISEQRLLQLEPQLPDTRKGIFSFGAWQKTAFAGLILLLVIVGGIGLQRNDQNSIWPVASTAQHFYVASTATMTQTSTATKQNVNSVLTSDPTPSTGSVLIDPKPEITPVPSPVGHALVK